MKFKAKKVFADHDENNILIIGFLGDYNDLGGPTYFMIQDSEEHNKQDQQLGMNTYYIEKNDQSMSGYGGIQELRLDKEKVYIELDKKGIENLKETEIVIELKCNDDEFENLQKRLYEILDDKLKTTYDKA